MTKRINPPERSAGDERKGLTLCCVLTTQRYNDNIYESLDPSVFRDWVKAMDEYESEWDTANYEREHADDHR